MNGFTSRSGRSLAWQPLLFATVLGAGLVSMPAVGAVTLIEPAASVTLRGGSALNVRWNATGAGTVTLEWSCRGSRWTLETAGQPLAGSWMWQTPLATASDCLLRVTQLDAGGAVVDRATSPPLTFDSLPPGTVTRLAFTVDGGAVVVDWVNPSATDLAAVRIYRNAPGATPVLVKTVSVSDAPNNQWVDNAVRQGNAYEYSLETLDTLGNVGSAATETRGAGVTPPRFFSGLATDGTRVWQLGGTELSQTYHGEIWEYDVLSDALSLKASALPPTAHPRAVWLEARARLLIVGGHRAGPVGEIWLFDPAADQLTLTSSVLPEPVTNGAIAYAPNVNRVYYFGGSTDSYSYGVLKTGIVEIDPLSLQTSTVGQLPLPTASLSAAFWPGDGNIYLFGGYTKTDAGTVQVLSTVARFDPNTRQYTALPVAAPDQVEAAVFATPNDIVMLRGLDGAGTYHREVFRFDPNTLALSARSLSLSPINRSWQSSGVIAQGIVVAASAFPPTPSLLRLHVSAGPYRVAVLQQLPTAQLVEPADQVVVAFFPDLVARFHDPADQGSVELQLCAQPACATVLQSVSVAGLASGQNASWRPSIAADAGLFYWRARGVDSVDAGAFTPVRTFALNEPPLAPVLDSPADRAVISTGAPRLSATFRDPVSFDTGRIDFQVCADALCTQPLANGSSAAGLPVDQRGEWVVTPPWSGDAGEVAYWRARATDALGLTSPYSETRQWVRAAPPKTGYLDSGCACRSTPLSFAGLAALGAAAWARARRRALRREHASPR